MSELKLRGIIKGPINEDRWLRENKPLVGDRWEWEVQFLFGGVDWPKYEHNLYLEPPPGVLNSPSKYSFDQPLVTSGSCMSEDAALSIVDETIARIIKDIKDKEEYREYLRGIQSQVVSSVVHEY